MAVPSDRRYSDSHEWFKIEEDIVTIGITQHAADELTDITYVEMRPSGEEVSAGGSLGEVESVKTTSEVYSAIGGEITEVNTQVSDDPSLVNSDPYAAGWLVKVRCSDPGPLESLMDSTTYDSRHADG